MNTAPHHVSVCMTLCFQIVKLHVGSQRHQTAVGSVRSGCPVWEEDVIMVAVEPFEETLMVEVYDVINFGVVSTTHVIWTLCMYTHPPPKHSDCIPPYNAVKGL